MKTKMEQNKQFARCTSCGAVGNTDSLLERGVCGKCEPKAVEEAWDMEKTIRDFTNKVAMQLMSSNDTMYAVRAFRKELPAFLASEIKAAHERGRLEMGVQASAIALEEIAEARQEGADLAVAAAKGLSDQTRTATIELFVEWAEGMIQYGGVLGKTRRWNDHNKALTDLLTFADSIKTNHEK